MSDDVLTIEHIQRALLADKLRETVPIVFVVPVFMAEEMRKAYPGVVVITQEQIALPVT